MSQERICELEIENYCCIRKTALRLSPLHALIGPNDSGKSTILRALRTAAQYAASDFAPTNLPTPFGTMLNANQHTSIVLKYRDELTYALHTQELAVREQASNGTGETLRSDADRSIYQPGLLQQNPSSALLSALRERISTATMVRFDPDSLRAPAIQLLASQPIRFQDETGKGLAGVYQAINSRDVDAFVAVRDQVRSLFPTVQSILVPNVENGMVVLQARLTDNTLVRAEALSEGLLYYLGFAALQHLADSRLFLVEEPENGLHPARISEVLQMLREISKTSQVVLATHSPLVVNELQASEVSIVTRPPNEGTQVVLLKDVPGYDDAAKVYLPGEFWVIKAAEATLPRLVHDRSAAH